MGRRYHSTKETYWLGWDGSISDDGQLNSADAAATGAAMLRPARKIEATAQKAAKKALKTLITAAGQNPVIVPIHISVRIFKIDVQGAVVWMPVQLKNYGQVRGLLLRVYDKAGNAIYHEYIDLPAGPHGVLAALTPLEKAASKVAPLSPVPSPSCAVALVPTPGFASTGHSLCRVEVWASRNAAVLSNKTIADELGADFNVYLHTVSSAYEPTAADIASKRRRYGDVWGGTGKKLYGYLSGRAAYAATQLAIANHAHQSQLDRAQKVLDGVYAPRTIQLGNGKPCVRIVLDKRATSDRQAFLVQDRLDDIQAQIQEAEDALAAEGVRTTPAHEIRIFIASEWYFRKSNQADVTTHAGHPSYDHAEFLDIVQRCKALSLLFPDWLIIPGTIYWTLQFAARLHTWTALDMAALQVDIVNSFAVPLANGANGVPRAPVVNPKACLNGNVALFLSGGNVVHYQFKQYGGEAEWQGHEFLTSTYLRQEHHHTVFRPSYFDFRGLLFGVDICRDHYEHRCFYERSGQLAAIRTDYLNEYANALIDVGNAIAALPTDPLLPLVRGYVATLLGIRQGNAVAAAPGVDEAHLSVVGLLPVAGPAPAGIVLRLAAMGALIAQIKVDRAVEPRVDAAAHLGAHEARYNPLNLAGAGADPVAFDALASDWTTAACAALKREEDKLVAMTAHAVTANHILNVHMAPLLLTPPDTANGILAIGALALNPAGPHVGDLDVMLIISNGTPNQQYGALNVAQGGILAQCDGARTTDCTVQQIQAINPALPAVPAHTRAQCATNMAAGGRAIATYDIIGMMFDVTWSLQQVEFDAPNLANAQRIFKFVVEFLQPLFKQLSAGRKALTSQLDEHHPRVVTQITVPSQAQTAVAPSSRYDDANIDTLLPPTGRGGTLLGRIL
ncbi:MAG: hypothetical protein ACMG6S_01240 [Byssovorax sp.]